MASNDQRTNDAIIYMGHKQDAIPRALWFDLALQGIDVRAWGLIRTQLDENNPVTISLHSFLRQQLGHSKATVSRILYVAFKPLDYALLYTSQCSRPQARPCVCNP